MKGVHRAWKSWLGLSGVDFKTILFLFLFFFFFFLFLRPHLQHMGVSRVGGKSERRLPGQPIATATQHPGPTPQLSATPDPTLILMDTSWILNLRSEVWFFVCWGFCLFVFLPFLGPHLRHMEIPRLGV